MFFCFFGVLVLETLEAQSISYDDDGAQDFEWMISGSNGNSWTARNTRDVYILVRQIK